MRKLTDILLITLLIINSSLSLEPIPYSINTKKWSHVLDDHFISITINPTDLLQGRVFGYVYFIYVNPYPNHSNPRTTPTTHSWENSFFLV